MSQSYQDWVDHNQETECAVCYGRGWVEYQTPPAAGSNHGQSMEVPCPYCHGRRDQGWAVERRSKRFDVWDRRRNWLIGATIVLFITGNAWPDAGYDPGPALYLWGLHVLLWLALLAGWVLWFINRRPKQETHHKQWHPGGQTTWAPPPPARHAPGFTTDQEKNALGLFGLGLAVR